MVALHIFTSYRKCRILYKINIGNSVVLGLSPFEGMLGLHHVIHILVYNIEQSRLFMTGIVQTSSMVQISLRTHKTIYMVIFTCVIKDER